MVCVCGGGLQIPSLRCGMENKKVAEWKEKGPADEEKGRRIEDDSDCGG